VTDVDDMVGRQSDGNDEMPDQGVDGHAGHVVDDPHYPRWGRGGW